MSNSIPISDRSRAVSILLCLLGLFGFCGVHRIYAGKVISGILQFLTLGLFGIWQIIDFIRLLLGAFTDSKGHLIR